MKLTSKAYWLIGAAITCCFCLTYCKKTLTPDSRRNDSRQNKTSTQQAAESHPNDPVEPTKRMAAGEPQRLLKPDGFSGTELLPKLGTPLSAPMLEALRQFGDLSDLPAAVLEAGGNTYGLDIDSGGGLIVNLGRDHTLLSFGFVSNEGEAQSDEEQHLLAEFILTGRPTVTVLDEKFEAVDMQIQTYESKVFPKKHALLYSKGRSRTLVFFDSTRVEMKKLLPVSPDTMDPTILKQLRSLVEQAK